MGILSHFSKKKQERSITCSAVVVAAGSATRMEGRDKIMGQLRGLPILLYSPRVFEESPLVEEIVVVTRAECLMEVAKLCKAFEISKVTKVVQGGETRTDSVLVGLDEVNGTLVAIHDGARPFLTHEVLNEVVVRAAECGAAAPAISVKDTIKVSKDGFVQRTPNRAVLYAVQTPQVFEVSLIRTALKKARQEHTVLTDDCSAVERLGKPVALTQGSEENIKLTTPTDLWLGEAILIGRDTR